MKSLLILFCYLFFASVLASQNECIQQGIGGGVIPDCNCQHDTVRFAATSFISPTLSAICNSTFFRYFFVELDRDCPYWRDEGTCMMEGCSVCTCPDEEIPKAWMTAKDDEDVEFGWVADESASDFSELEDSLGKVSLSTPGQNDGGSQTVPGSKRGKGRNNNNNGNQPNSDGDVKKSNYREANSVQKTSDFFLNLYKTEDCDNFNAAADSQNTWTAGLHDPPSDVGVYVNLLQNPERFTGYSGPPARRVWRAIKEENCFSPESQAGAEDTCLEKRIFFRLMSGLQASISTHIARSYRFTDDAPLFGRGRAGSGQERWGENLPLFWSAVGDHPQRVDNLYFSFLFLLRAVVKAGHLLVSYPYDTGNPADDRRVRELIAGLVSVSTAGRGGEERGTTTSLPHLVSAPTISQDLLSKKAVEECSSGFDESTLFQVSEEVKGSSYWQLLEDKQILREEFKFKFRNISRILDCVSCEKCRLWGKLQILGMGTAIKILLTDENELLIKRDMDVWETRDNPGSFLNRQEIIALLNTLNQFSKSVAFSDHALSQRRKIAPEGKKAPQTELREKGSNQQLLQQESPANKQPLPVDRFPLGFQLLVVVLFFLLLPLQARLLFQQIWKR